MGLDIYFHKTQSTSNNFKTAYDEDTKHIKENFSKDYDKLTKKLAKTNNADEYNKAYINGMKKLSKYSNYPQFDLGCLGVSFDYQTNEYKYSPLSIDMFLSLKDKAMKEITPRYDAYFRKVNFLYRYFFDIIDEESQSAWASIYDIEELIERCGIVLKKQRKPDDILPTMSGFFFGSTDYDEWYFNDVKNCKKQMKALLRGLKDNERIYVHFSW